jgi:hypothetical protein
MFWTAVRRRSWKAEATFTRPSAPPQLVERFPTWPVVEVKGHRLSFCAVVSGGRFRTWDAMK